MSKIMELADAYATQMVHSHYHPMMEARAALQAEVEMMQADVDNKADIAQRAIAERDALREKLAAVERDAARMDWLEKHACVITDSVHSCLSIGAPYNTYADFDDIRTAVDNAMEATK